MKHFWFGNRAWTAGAHSANILSSSSILALDISAHAKTETKSVGFGWEVIDLWIICAPPPPLIKGQRAMTYSFQANCCSYWLIYYHPNSILATSAVFLPSGMWCFEASAGERVRGVGVTVGAAVAGMADNPNWLPRGSPRGEEGEGTKYRGMMKRTTARAGPD